MYNRKFSKLVDVEVDDEELIEYVKKNFTPHCQVPMIVILSQRIHQHMIDSGDCPECDDHEYELNQLENEVADLHGQVSELESQLDDCQDELRESNDDC